MFQGMRTLLGHWLYVPTVAPGTRFPAAAMQVEQGRGVIMSKACFTLCDVWLFFPPISK